MHAARIADACCQRGDLRRTPRAAQKSGQPVHRASGDRNISLACKLDAIVERPRDRRRQTRGRGDRRRNRGHQRRAGAIGRLDHSRAEGSMAKQCRVRVADQTGNWHPIAKHTARNRLAILMAGWQQLGQRCRRNAEQIRAAPDPIPSSAGSTIAFGRRWSDRSHARRRP